jgi:hypothetical protein
MELLIRAGGRIFWQVWQPFPLRLAWDHSKRVSLMPCHRRLAENFARSLPSEAWAETESHEFPRGFAFRRQRTEATLSSHRRGIAIDLNSESNRQGSSGNMDAELIAVFRDAGFRWGG